MAAADGANDDSQATLTFGEGNQDMVVDGLLADVANPLRSRLPYPIDYDHLKIGTFVYSLDKEDHIIIIKFIFVNFHSSAKISLTFLYTGVAVVLDQRELPYNVVLRGPILDGFLGR